MKNAVTVVKTRRLIARFSAGSWLAKRDAMPELQFHRMRPMGAYT